MSYTPLSKRISVLNSTIAPLDAAATFTGSWEDVAHYDSVIVAVSTDQKGTFTVQFSPDGTNADSTLTRYYNTDQIEAPHRFTITRRYVRVTFTNTSASNQTYIRLQVMYGEKTELNAPLDSTLSQDFDSLSTRPTQYEQEVALGRRQGHALWNKWGFNNDVDNSSPEIIASWGGTFTRLPTAQSLDIESTSTDDDDGGIGANSIIIYGVDGDWLEQIETVTMDGTTPVTTTNTWLGVNRVAVALAGTSEDNVGAITLTGSTASTIQGQIPIGAGSSQQAIFFVQADHRALITHVNVNIIRLASGGAQPETNTRLWAFSDVSNSRYELRRFYMDTEVTNEIDRDWSKNPLPVGEKSIIYLETDTDTNDTEVSASFSLFEVRNVDA